MPAETRFYASAFGPEDIAEIVAAYEAACRKVGSTDRNDHVRQFLARRVMSAAMTGERRAAQICERALVGVGQAA